ncbi:iron(III) transport system permease protein [Acidovorax soli]|uniref:Iron(III) transport system permease protein n=1 Tax=Acidovorax soli TaxID=592050 RepID=A0A7X0PH63_9BURK|nr:iron ABC transporter permease [Acidovorax soli]MBB6561684.1 iron(III) transport system permease protein [Acidovorax soli]
MSAVFSDPGAAGPGAARPRRLLHALSGVGPWLAFGLILAFLALFLLIPVGLVVYTAFINETGALTIGHFANFFEQSVFRESFFNSLVVSLASVFFASLIAVPLAYLTVRFEFRGALLIQTLGVLPLIMPPFVGAVALQLIFGRNGSVNLLLNEYLGFTVPIMDGLVGVTFVESIHYFPFILLNLVAAMRNIDGAMEESALNLGARGWRLFRRVIFPLAMPGYLAGAALVFVKVFDDLGTPLVMGVTNMLAPQAYLRITSVGIDDPLGYVISVIMIAFSILALWMAARVMKGKDYATLQKGGSALQRRRLSTWESVLAYGWIGLILLVTLAPHIGILLMSFSKVWSFSVLPDAYTLEHYATVFTDSKQMIGNTLLYCFIAAGLDVVIGTSIAYLILRTQLPARRWLDYLASAALAIPGLVLAIGYLRMFKGVNLPFTDTPVVTTWVLIMLAYAVRRLPYALRSCMAALQQVHVSLEEAAQSLGASRLSTIRRVMVPLMMGGILAGFVTSFITAAVELSATILLASAQSQAPMSYGIYLYMQSISGRGPGAALGVLAVLVVGLGTYFSHRFVERSRTTVQAKQG